MITSATLSVNTGYSVRVWMALRAVKSAQCNCGPEPVLLAFEALRVWVRSHYRRAIRDRACAAGVKLICIPVLPKKMPWSTQLNTAWCALVIGATIRLTGIKVVHAQSHLAAAATAAALMHDVDRQMVFDVHGVDIEESVADGRLTEGTSAYNHRLLGQKRSILRSDWIITVSTSLRKYLNSFVSRDSESIVVPCVSSFELPFEDCRTDARSRLGVGNRPVILYLGGASDWQQPELIIESFVNLRHELPAAYLLIITSDCETFRKLLEKHNLLAGSYQIISVSHAEVPKWGCAADVGILYRRNTLVNRVSSPTKFAEYLTMGVPVILSDVLEDFADITKQYRVGCVISADNDAKGLAKGIIDVLKIDQDRRDQLRDRCRDAVLNELSFAAAVERYKMIYGVHQLEETGI